MFLLPILFLVAKKNVRKLAAVAAILSAIYATGCTGGQQIVSMDDAEVRSATDDWDPMLALDEAQTVAEAQVTHAALLGLSGGHDAQGGYRWQFLFSGDLNRRVVVDVSELTAPSAEAAFTQVSPAPVATLDESAITVPFAKAVTASAGARYPDSAALLAGAHGHATWWLSWRSEGRLVSVDATTGAVIE
ncbi:MAG: hypothetical protein JST92_09090 [Deltaproteobacteria bacterium]|nr:hypothetical protein [Deltaproteobacteria bacterium]